jgi:hypothetical protein
LSASYSVSTPARDCTLTIGPLEMNFDDTSIAALRYPPPLLRRSRTYAFAPCESRRFSAAVSSTAVVWPNTLKST